MTSGSCDPFVLKGQCAACPLTRPAASHASAFALCRGAPCCPDPILLAVSYVAPLSVTGLRSNLDPELSVLFLGPVGVLSLGLLPAVSTLQMVAPANIRQAWMGSRRCASLRHCFPLLLSTLVMMENLFPSCEQLYFMAVVFLDGPFYQRHQPSTMMPGD